MKNLFLTLAFLLIGTSFFASNEYYYLPSEAGNKTNSSTINSQEFEYLSPISADTMRPCRWRTVTIWSDGSKSYGPWTYGYCLDEVQLN